DWQKYAFGQIGKRSSIQLNLSGGDSRTSFRVNSGYDYDKDILTEEGGNYRGSLSFNLNHKSLNQRFKFSISALYSISRIDVVNRNAGAVLLPPNAPDIYDNDGKLNYNGWGNLSTRYSFGGLLETYKSKTNFL